MAHGDAREGKWRGTWRMEWVASTLHTASEHGVSSISTADAHTSAASSQLNWRPRRFEWTRPFRRKTKSGVCACAITFQTQSAILCEFILCYAFPLQVPAKIASHCQTRYIKIGGSENIRLPSQFPWACSVRLTSYCIWLKIVQYWYKNCSLKKGLF
jgi:hypothetical protein